MKLILQYFNDKTFYVFDSLLRRYPEKELAEKECKKFK